MGKMVREDHERLYSQEKDYEYEQWYKNQIELLMNFIRIETTKDGDYNFGVENNKDYQIIIVEPLLGSPDLNIDPDTKMLTVAPGKNIIIKVKKIVQDES